MITKYIWSLATTYDYFFTFGNSYDKNYILES